MQPSIINQALGLEGMAFLRHWVSIRVGEELVPDVDRWIEKLTGALALHTYRAELARDDCVLLFAGSWLIARRALGQPGESVYGGYPGRKAQALPKLRMVVQRPCGYFVDRKSEQDGTHLQTVILPLRVPVGSKPQIVSYVELLAGPATAGIVEQTVDKRNWIDVGAGIPEEMLPQPPLRF